MQTCIALKHALQQQGQHRVLTFDYPTTRFCSWEILNFLNLLETSKYLKMVYRKSPLWCVQEEEEEAKRIV